MNAQIERLELAGIILSKDELTQYLKSPDVYSNGVIPKGYKRCTKCGKSKKLYMFNKNNTAKDKSTTQCKECQKATAHKSYAKQRVSKKYKEYYQLNKEKKREVSRKYYQDNKEKLKATHAKYRATSKGKKAMNKAHSKRAQLLQDNKGIPYTREQIIARDSQGGTEPLCYWCGKPITGTPHLDHVIPVAIGGMDCFTNIACVHGECNLTKSKDGRDVTEEHVNHVSKLSTKYMDDHPEEFPDFFES